MRSERDCRKRSATAAGRSLALGVLGLLLGGGGCDGAAAVSGTAGDGGLPDASAGVAALCESAVPGTLDLIDDMEDGNNRIAARGGRTAWWYTYDDGSQGTINPATGTQVVMETIPGGRCGSSTKAMRVTGSGFMTWGCGFGLDLNSDATYTRIPYDASTSAGVTFWARTGEQSVNGARLLVNDQWSDPVGGHCDLTQTSGSTACWDAFGVAVPLTKTWTRYTYRWGEMQQRMFGIPRDALDTSTLTQIHFEIAAGAPVFDIWIDDISFFQ